MYELDKVVWNNENGNVKRSDEEAAAIFHEIIDNDSWIIEDVGREKFIDGVKNADMVYYIQLGKFTVFKRCILRWIKQKSGLESYNYKPTFDGLIQMLKWAAGDIKSRPEKLAYIKNNSKRYKILKPNDIKKMSCKIDID